MKQKIARWGFYALSAMVLVVGASSVKLPSFAYFYQPKAPEALRRDR